MERVLHTHVDKVDINNISPPFVSAEYVLQMDLYFSFILRVKNKQL
jgi:hypothetical protein